LNWEDLRATLNLINYNYHNKNTNKEVWHSLAVLI
jgi:hypothetical protein